MIQNSFESAELRALSKKNYQRNMKLPDAIVAATAFVYSSVLVTRNVGDFDHLLSKGLQILNPFA